jgi:hypothetical protein
MTAIKTIIWIGATPFILLALFAFARFVSCGPDREVVRVAKPVAQIIADDIVKNGIPESLKDIKGLPYELEGCKRKVIYQKDSYEEVKRKEEADYVIREERCYFKKKRKSYEIWLWFIENNLNNKRSHGTVTINNKESYTELETRFRVEENNSKYVSAIGNGYAKPYRFICSSFKQ